MKTYTTTTLQKLVLDRMSPRYPSMSDEEIDDWIAQLPQISATMFSIMSREVFGFFSNKLVSRHLSQIRKECTLMLDALYNYPDCAANMQNLHQQVTGTLLAILQHLQLNYSKYLDANLAMPQLLFKEAAQKIESTAVVMVTAMSRYHADKRLQALVTGKMTGLLKKGSGSWHQISYLQKLQGCIMELCIGREFNITSKLRHLLLHTNFNTSGFIAWCKNEMEDSMAECFELRGRYNCMFRYQREFSALVYQHKFSRFEPAQRKLKEILLEHVNSELRMMDNKEAVVTEKKVAAIPGAQARLPVSISVNVLACLFRLLFTVGVVTGHKSELWLFMSRSFQTPGAGSDDLSLKSVENKYKQVVKRTATTVRSVLLKMLKQLDDEFTGN